MALRYSPGFYPFSGPSLGTHPSLSSILAQIPHFRHSPRFHLSGTRPDSTLSWYSLEPFSGMSPDSTFLTVARILPFPYTHLDPSPVLARIPPFRHSPGFYPFRYLPGSTFMALTQILPFFGTRQDSTFLALARIIPFPILARIPHFRHSPGFYPFLVLTRTLLRYSPRFHISGTHLDSTLSRYSSKPFFDTRPDSTFPVLSRTSNFSELTRILHFFGTSPDFYFSGTRPESALFQHSPGFCPFPTLTRIPLFQHFPRFYLFQYSLGFHLSGTCPNFTFPTLAWILPFPMPALALFRCLPGPFSSACSDFIIFSGIVPGSLIFPGIVLGFL